MRILTFKKVYLIHGKQRLEWLWVFQPWFLSWNTGVTADLDPSRIWTPGPNPLADMDPPGPNPLADMDPIRRFEPPLPKVPFKYRFYHTWSLILFGSFLPIFFSITKQHSSVKVKKNSRAVLYPSQLMCNHSSHNSHCTMSFKHPGIEQ